MKSTGIVRRLDDLGRVVIPKEIRRTLGIREGDALEIFTDTTDKTVTFKRYSNVGAVEKDFFKTLHTVLDKNYIIFDGASFIYSSFSFHKKLVINDYNRNLFLAKESLLNADCFPMEDGEELEFDYFKTYPIKVNGETVGAILVIGTPTEEEEKIISLFIKMWILKIS